MLTIVAPLEHELAGLRRRVPGQGTCAAIKSRDAGKNRDADRPAVALHVIGVGRREAQAGMRRLLTGPGFSFPPEGRREISSQAVLLLGFAGAVDPSLSAGDLLIPQLYYLDGRRRPPDILLPDVEPVQSAGDEDPDFLEADPNFLALAKEVSAAGGRPGAVFADSLTVANPAGTPDVKAGLRGCYPVGAVNMEDYWVAREARRAGLPFLAVRAVLDTAGQGLPGYLPELARVGGRAVSGSLSRPWRWPVLARLACQMRLAQRALTRFALSFIDGLGRGLSSGYPPGPEPARTAGPGIPAAGNSGERFNNR